MRVSTVSSSATSLRRARSSRHRADDRVRGRGLRLRLGGAAFGDPGREVLDPGKQLALVEGLGHVVVGAEFKPDDPVDLVGPAGQQDDPDLRDRPLFAGDREPVLAVEVDVDEQHVGRVAREDLFHRRRVRGFADPVHLLAQRGGEAAAGDRVVFDDHDMLRHLDPLFGTSAFYILLQIPTGHSSLQQDRFTGGA